MHRVVDSRRSAFQGRLKHYQKQGFPAGINTGRGRAATYNIEHALQMAVALEMNQVGLNPERAAQICTSRAARIRAAINLAVTQILSDDQESILIVFDPLALSDLCETIDWDETLMSFDVVSVPEFRSNLEAQYNLPSRRYALIDVTAVVLALTAGLAKVAGNERESLLVEIRKSTNGLGGWANDKHS